MEWGISDEEEENLMKISEFNPYSEIDEQINSE